MNTRELTEKAQNWWYCDNIVCHPDLVGLLNLDFPRVFILFRNEADIYIGTFEEWKEGVAEVNFLDNDRDKYTDRDIENILVDAWNFMALQEEEEERRSYEYEDDDDI